MTITTITGKKLTFNNITVKCPFYALPAEHQKAIIASQLPPDTETFHIFVANCWKINKEGKEIKQWSLVNWEEAERILINNNHPCVWYEGPDVTKQYWIAYAEMEREELDYRHWSFLGRDFETDACDPDIQWIVHEFYTHGGLEPTLQFLEEEIASITIPQREEYLGPREQGPFDAFFGPEKPRTEKDYIKAVKDAVNTLQNYERALYILRSWGSRWRIICTYDPKRDSAIINKIDKGGHVTLTGVGLRNWLAYHLVSQAKAAELCGVNPRTFRRWLTGKPPIPKAMLELLKTKILGKK